MYMCEQSTYKTLQLRLNKINIYKLVCLLVLEEKHIFTVNITRNSIKWKNIHSEYIYIHGEYYQKRRQVKKEQETIKHQCLNIYTSSKILAFRIHSLKPDHYQLQYVNRTNTVKYINQQNKSTSYHRAVFQLHNKNTCIFIRIVYIH